MKLEINKIKSLLNDNKSINELDFMNTIMGMMDQS
jgi:hypothetical protein